MGDNYALIVGGLALAVVMLFFAYFMFDIGPEEPVRNESNNTRYLYWYKFPDFLYECVPPYGRSKSDVEIIGYFQQQNVDIVNFTVEQVTLCTGPKCGRGLYLDLLVDEGGVNRLDQIVSSQSEECYILRQ